MRRIALLIILAAFAAWRLRATRARARPEFDIDYMCPNCRTPWDCNGPHVPDIDWLGASDDPRLLEVRR